jgi:LPXTG-site transpeptidase (sortase) family protein
MPKFKPYKYLKDYSFDPFYKQVNWKFYGRTRLLSYSLLGIGIIIFVVEIAIPIYMFKTDDVVARPMAQSVAGVATGFSSFKFSELNGNPEETDQEANIPQYFYLTIPKLRIKEASVESNSPTLQPDKALGHYKGTSLPDKPGNMFIYGHSVLPMFYNPRNYKSIFSTLGDLKTGDEIMVKYNNVEYTYKVESKVVMDPIKVDPSAQFKPAYLNESTITLMTCWPAGTKSKRLMVYGTRVNSN